MDDGQWLVATGQKSYERDEVVYSLTLSQLLPWLVLLPLLLLAMTWAVRRALAPVLELSDELRERAAEDLRPLSDERAPHELKPLVGAMNGLFTRIDATLARQLVREIKDSKLKVQAAVQGGEVRITGKKRDDLQAAITLVRGLKIEQPLQYLNFRE